MQRERRTRALEQKKLDEMKAFVDNSPPRAHRMKHLELRPKKMQLKEGKRT